MLEMINLSLIAGTHSLPISSTFIAASIHIGEIEKPLHRRGSVSFSSVFPIVKHSTRSGYYFSPNQGGRLFLSSTGIIPTEMPRSLLLRMQQYSFFFPLSMQKTPCSMHRDSSLIKGRDPPFQIAPP